MTIIRIKQGNLWVARGYDDYDPNVLPPDPPGDNLSYRESLDWGVLLPNTSDLVGVLPDVPRRDGGVIHSSLPTNTSSTERVTLGGSAGQTFYVSNMKIYGDVFPSSTMGAHWIFQNCEFVGGLTVPSSISAIINCDVARPGSTSTNSADNTGRVTVMDSDIHCQTKKLNRDGVRGHKVTLIRCKMYDTTDGMAPLIPIAKGTHTNWIARGCWTFHRIYGYPDYRNGVSGEAWQTDGTHNDGCQAQGGANLELTGNFFENNTVEFMIGSQPNPSKPWLITTQQANGAGLIIQLNTPGVPQFTTTNTIIQDNWFKDGLSHLNVKPNVQFTYLRNKHFVATAVRPPGATGQAHGGYRIRTDNVASNIINGLWNGTTWTNTTNVWADGPNVGQPLKYGTTGVSYGTAIYDNVIQ